METIKLEIINFTVADVIATSIEIPIKGTDDRDSRI